MTSLLQWKYVRNTCLFLLLIIIVVSVVWVSIYGASQTGTLVNTYHRSGLRGLASVVAACLSKPSVDWVTGKPDNHGLDSDKLNAFRDELAKRKTEALLVVKDGKLVYEWYTRCDGANRPVPTAAISKAVTASMILLLALNDGHIDIDEPVSNFIPSWKEDPRKAKITFRHLATHTSGLEDVIFRPDMLTGWKEDYYHNKNQRFDLAIAVSRVLFEPGTRYSYSGLGFHPLAYALAVSLQDAPESDLRALLAKRVLAPLGIPETAWQISYGESYDINGVKLYSIGSGGKHTPRMLARIGQFLLNKGEWNGKQLFSAELVESLVAPTIEPVPSFSGNSEPPTGLGWWLNSNEFWPALPYDAYLSVGSGHRILLIIPSQDIVMVRLGDAFGTHRWGDPFWWQQLEEHLFAPFMDSIGQ